MKKLYKVTCKGMQACIAGNSAHGVSFVVADNPDDAYRVVRASLDKRDIGFTRDRTLEKVELLAEQADYPDCGFALYV